MRGDEARAAEVCECGHERAHHDPDVGCVYIGVMMTVFMCQCSEFVARRPFDVRQSS